jgi:hypothetical protein
LPHDSEPSPSCPQTKGVGRYHIAVIECSRQLCRPRPRPALPHEISGENWHWLEESSDCPDEPSQFAGDGRGGLVRSDARTQVAIAVMQTQLGTPGEIDDRALHIDLSLLERVAYSWRVARVVRRLAEDVP